MKSKEGGQLHWSPSSVLCLVAKPASGLMDNLLLKQAVLPRPFSARTRFQGDYDLLL